MVERHVGSVPAATDARDATEYRLLDRVMPTCDVSDAHRRRIAASPERVYAALKGLTVRQIPILGFLLGMRTLPGRITGRRIDAPRRDRPLLDSILDGGFILLGEEPNREIVVGTVGQFWKVRGNVTYPIRDVAEFAGCVAPGHAKAAMTFHLRPARGGTLLTTETRILATEPRARRAFARYWRVIYPGSALIRWAWLRAIERAARRGWPCDHRPASR